MNRIGDGNIRVFRIYKIINVYILLIFIKINVVFCEEMLKENILSISNIDFRAQARGQNFTPYSNNIQNSSGIRFMPGLMFKQDKNSLFSILFTPLVAFDSKKDDKKNIYVHQLYLTADMNDLGIGFKVGRQEINFNKGVLFSNNYDLLFPQSFDGVVGKWHIWQNDLNFINLINHQNDSMYLSKPKEVLYGIYDELEWSDLKLDMYYLIHRKDEGDYYYKNYFLREGEYKNAKIYGSRFGLEKFHILFNLEYIGQRINYINYDDHKDVLFQGKAHVVDFTLGTFWNIEKYSIESQTEFNYFSGTENYVDNFGDQGINLGLSRIFGRRNLNGMAFRQKVDYIKKIKILIEYIQYYKNNSEYPVYHADGTVYKSKRYSNDRQLGYQWGLAFKYNPGEICDLYLQAYEFHPEQYIKQVYADQLQRGFVIGVDVKY